VLDLYGWNETFQASFDTITATHPGLIPARVTVQQRGLYRVVSEEGELSCGLSGRFMLEARPGEAPVAGDWVAVAPRTAEGAGTIHNVLTRLTAFTRSGPRGALQVVAANLDYALLVSSLNGDLNQRRTERYLAAARESGALPVIVLTKADAAEEPEALRAKIVAIAGDAPVLAVSAVTGEGMGALGAYLAPGKTAALLGSSGVGKSTLVNALAGEMLMTTQAISGDDKRGRHTTTHRELILLPSGGLILDSPGMRELGVGEADTGVQATFADVEDLIEACKFSDCRHSNEPGCAVRAALEDGELEQARWDSYQKLKRELAFEGRKEDPNARAEHRKRWIKIHKNNRARTKWRDEN
jgi:ribosome biogenesis GTPase / thiamine phosphate phosphatase